ncbi:hypothetical protein BDF20DRAFT_871236 [Mycotypha africana]|uniref:uncharacterized protein n=1 Tax=Mycotypha africana TaxID=64632 RepID=UPI0023000C82|nr:uncharacterized protein BDF20DRAFT_871236 [Mycotypha africana]KAI8979717.1 hypothetical protein BDF20DRAFT_871236 [Mycotypha africana]
MSFSDDDNTDSSSSIVEKTRKHQYLEQVWFPGMHTDVGGGQDDDDDSPKCGNIISYQALQWMVDKAVSVGLRFKDINIEKKTDTNIKFNEAAEKCYSFKYNDSYESKFIYRLMPRQDRIIEPDAA